MLLIKIGAASKNMLFYKCGKQPFELQGAPEEGLPACSLPNFWTSKKNFGRPKKIKSFYKWGKQPSNYMTGSS